VKESVDHILRPRLPWRARIEITECGLDAAEVSTLTREEFAARLKDYGKQRTAMTVCMTCMHTAQRWPTWSEDPRTALMREVVWEDAGYWNGSARGGPEPHGHQLRDDLAAIEILVATHMDEFRKLLSIIDARNEWRELKTRKEHQ
jgi:hypothetical protein